MHLWIRLTAHGGTFRPVSPLRLACMPHSVPRSNRHPPPLLCRPPRPASSPLYMQTREYTHAPPSVDGPTCGPDPSGHRPAERSTLHRGGQRPKVAATAAKARRGHGRMGGGGRPAPGPGAAASKASADCPETSVRTAAFAVRRRGRGRAETGRRRAKGRWEGGEEVAVAEPRRRSQRNPGEERPFASQDGGIPAQVNGSRVGTTRRAWQSTSHAPRGVYTGFEVFFLATGLLLLRLVGTNAINVLA